MRKLLSGAGLYSRMRYEDPSGDFGRQGRNRDVVISMSKKLLTYSATQYKSVFETIGSHMTTDLTVQDINQLILDYHNCINDVEQIQLTGSGQMIDRIWYLVVPESDIQSAAGILRTNLGLSS